jgi:putative ABC transport system permease protein
MLGIPVVEGREFNGDDVAGGPGPIIINQALAQRWGQESLVGEKVGVIKAARTRADFGEPLVGQVVGVVGDLNRAALGGPQRPAVYVPLRHNPWPEVNVVARSRGAPEAMFKAVEDAIREVEPAIPLDGPFVGAATVVGGVARAAAGERFNARLVSAFAAVALLLAAVGMYGVISYTVSLRTREIGVRMALGATPHGVLESVVRGVAGIAMIGLGLGVAGALALTRLLTGLLFEVQVRDPATFVGVGAILMMVAMLAGYFPARRAGRVDPLVALRGD